MFSLGFSLSSSDSEVPISQGNRYAHLRLRCAQWSDDIFFRIWLCKYCGDRLNGSIGFQSQHDVAYKPPVSHSCGSYWFKSAMYSDVHLAPLKTRTTDQEYEGKIIKGR